MAENEQIVQTPITININGREMNSDGTVMGLMVSWLKQLDGTLGQIKTTLDDQSQLNITDDIKDVSEGTIKKIRTSIYNLKRTITKQIESGNIALSQDLNKLLGLVTDIDTRLGGLSDIESSISEIGMGVEAQNNLIKDILKRQENIEKALIELKKAQTVATPVPSPTPVSGDTSQSENEDTATTGDDSNPKPAEDVPSEETDNTGASENVNNPEDETTKKDPVTGVARPENEEIEVTAPDDDKSDDKEKGDDSSSTENKPEENPEPNPQPVPVTALVPVEDKKNDVKFKKAKFLTKSLKETAILSEPKRPWYKRLATFAIGHPWLTVLAGAGIGLGVVGAMCGITLAAGFTGMLSAANFFLPSLAIGTGVGAIGGGVFSVVSRLLPGGRKERLYRKFAKQYKKAMNIDRTKDLFAVFEEKHKEQRKQARENDRQKKGILKSLGVYKVARNYHKMMSRASRKMKRYYTKQYTPAVEKALKTKNNLNIKETKKGKTMAVAGYLQKRKKLEDKLMQGKIDEEEFEEDMADLEEDVADITGEYGISETNQMTYDKEAVTLIEKVKKEKRSKGMDVMLENIKKRNSKEVVTGVEERVFVDPKQIAKEIARLKAENNMKEAEKLIKYLEKIKRDRKEYEIYAVENGLEVDEIQDATVEETTHDHEKEQ